jgi:hypothetical protein
VLTGRPPSRISYAQPFAFSISSLEIDYSPRVSGVYNAASTSWRRVDARAQYVEVVILVNAQMRAAKAFEHQTAALRWADEQRVINTDAAC